MSVQVDVQKIPMMWINLNRQKRRRARMEWAIQNGGWNAHRVKAVDTNDSNQNFLPIANFLKGGSSLPGIYRNDEAEPKRCTSRAELACLASWKRLIINAKKITSPSGWFLLMEDDLGASLAKPEAWAHSLTELIEFCPSRTLAVQLAPTNASLKQDLAAIWTQSRGRCLAISKENVRSHGNGAVLLHQRALDFLDDPLLSLCNTWKKNWHPLFHPWKIRPVADKWLYGALPPGSCQVATYPHFCLEAEDSGLHPEHVEAFHLPSRLMTMRIWNQDQRQDLVDAQKIWDSITGY